MKQRFLLLAPLLLMITLFSNTPIVKASTEEPTQATQVLVPEATTEETVPSADLLPIVPTETQTPLSTEDPTTETPATVETVPTTPIVPVAETTVPDTTAPADPTPEASTTQPTIPTGEDSAETPTLNTDPIETQPTPPVETDTEIPAETPLETAQETEEPLADTEPEEAVVEEAAAAIMAMASAEAFSTGTSQYISYVNTSDNVIALTFDDGHSYANLSEILAILEVYGAKATFFMNGDASAELLKQIVDSGHELGNHTYSHQDSTIISADALAYDINLMEDYVQESTGTTSRPLFRAPYGALNNSVLETVGSLGYEYTIGWSIDTLDWSGLSATTISSTIMNNVNPGDIVLMHASVGAVNTPASLWYTLSALQNAGYRFSTIGQLLGIASEDIVEEVIIEEDSVSQDPGGVNELTGLDPIQVAANPIITKDIVTDRTGQLGVAEPYIVYEDGVYHMFFDVILGYNPDTQSTADEIGHAYSTDMINWTYTQIVLGEETNGTRAASPYVMEYEDTYYMIPDRVGDVNVYQASSFPLEWELYGTLLSGNFVDPLVFSMNNVWYMTVSQYPYNSLSLYYNTSGDWRNSSWVLHSSSQILPETSTEGGLRNAGNAFIYENSVIIPVEVTPKSNNIYGEYTDWYELSNLSTTTVTVTRRSNAVISQYNDDWNGDAMHHISYVAAGTGYYYATDGYNWNNNEYSIGLFTGTDPSDTKDPVIPSDPVEPIDPVDPVDPTDPTAVPTVPVNLSAITGAENPLITKDMVTDRTGQLGVAEPYIVYEDGVYHMFFDVILGYNSATGSTADEIGHAYSTDMINWTYTQIVLGEETNGTRAASPYVMEYGDAYYMVPDRVGDVNVYKASAFPLEWELYGTLLSGNFVDPLVFSMDNIWYMTVSEFPYNSLSLYYNTSGDWRNSSWVLHSSTQILPETSTEGGLRNGGMPIIYEDSVVIPVEVTPKSNNIYGEYTTWYELSNLSPTTVTVTNKGTAVISQYNDEWNGDAMHHISYIAVGKGFYYATDGYNWNRNEYSIGIFKGGTVTVPTDPTDPTDPVDPVLPTAPVTMEDIALYYSVRNPILSVDSITDRVAGQGIANPYVILEDGTYHVFFNTIQAYNPNTGVTADEIAHAWSTDLQQWNYTQVVLGVDTTGTNVASPYVFMYENEYYMIPDLSGNVNVYKASSFPLGWEFYGTLLNGNFVDPLVFVEDDIWYLATTAQPYDSLSLYYNTSGDWRNSSWTLHPQGTIITATATESDLRTAGSPFYYEGAVVLPIQVTPSNGRYGEYTYWYQLSNLTPTTISVINLGLAVEAQKNETWNSDAMHHISNAAFGTGNIYFVDGMNDGIYTIGLYTDLAQTIYPPVAVPFPTVTNPILTTSIVTDRTGQTGIADPFIYLDNGIYYIFFEIIGGYNAATGLTADEVGYVWSADLVNWTYGQVVIGPALQGVRAAYPNVFTYESNYYMLPDLAGNVNAYTTTNFPNNWTYYSMLLQGTYSDTNVFNIDGTWYMTTAADPYVNLSLYHNTSGDWRNDQWVWQEDILIGTGAEYSYRSAGNPFIYDDYIIMPVQAHPDGGMYGEYTYWVKLSNFSTTAVDVDIMSTAVTAIFNGGWNDESMHHISHADYLDWYVYIADGYNNGVYSLGLYIEDSLV